MLRASIAYVVYFVAIGAAVPYLAVYYRELGLDLQTIGLLAALSAAVQLVSAPVWGGLSDASPRSRVPLATAAVLAGVAALGLAQARALPAIIGAVVVLSVGLSGIGPILDARAVDTVRDDRSRYAHLRVWGSISFIVTAPLVGLVVDRQGAGGFFLVYVPALLLTALASLALDRRSGPRLATSDVLHGASAVLRDRQLALFMCGALLAWTALAGVSAFFSIYLVQLGAAGNLVGLAWSVGALVEVPVMWAFPALARRFGTERLIVFGAAILVARAACYSVLTSPAALVGVSLLTGLGFGLLLVGGITFVAHHAPRGLSATAQGVFSATVNGLASILGSGLAGLGAAAVGIPGLFAACAAAGLVAVGVIAAAVLPAAGPSPITIRLANEESAP